MVVAAEEVVEYQPDPGYVGFTAKAQKSKTRKGKDYFVIRVTIPKYAADQIKIDPEDYLVLKAKKALWYHMMDWTEMKPAWQMLPPEIKTDVILAGLPNPEGVMLTSPTSLQANWTGFGASISSNQATLQRTTTAAVSASQGVG